MLLSYALLVCSCALPSLTGAQSASASAAPSSTSSGPLTVYTLKADGITAEFIPYGARLTSLLVKDRNGTFQDVVAGYDNTSQYPIDTATNHTYFGPVVGRYANRIKNGTFTINGQTSHIAENEHGGIDTLHGGKVGYDARNWTVTSVTDNSITFTLVDKAFEGFPGTVITHASYAFTTETLGNAWGTPHPRMTTRIVSVALDSTTPIMLANHIYWNLNGFKLPTILNDTTLYMPYSKRYIETDGILIPNGTIGTVASRPPLDYTTPKLLGTTVPKAVDVCGTGCTGLDSAFILDRPVDTGAQASNFPVLSLWSQYTGIRLDVSTNQQGLQIYTCDGQNGTIPVKQSQISRNTGAPNGGDKFVNKYGCVVIETQAWIDGINHPEWGVSDYEIFSPTTQPVTNYATYDFSNF